MNIWIRGSFFTIVSACFVQVACWAYETPAVPGGREMWPYSVIQIGTARWYHFVRSRSNCGNVDSVTFGYRTFCSGGRFGDVGYGWCAQASNFRPGCCGRRRANVPGAIDALTPESGLSRPRADVSPIATLAARFPALIPVWAGLKSFA